MGCICMGPHRGSEGPSAGFALLLQQGPVSLSRDLGMLWFHLTAPAVTCPRRGVICGPRFSLKSPINCLSRRCDSKILLCSGCCWNHSTGLGLTLPAPSRLCSCAHAECVAISGAAQQWAGGGRFRSSSIFSPHHRVGFFGCFKTEPLARNVSQW